jgi:polar amino acid transport system substrate-binding protein
MKKLLVFVVIALLLVSSTLVATTLENIVKKGKIVVASDMTAVPMQYRNPTGKPTGFTVELMELAAKEMGVQIEWQDMAWESLIPSLLSGKVDMIAANMSMTLTRMKSIVFPIRTF